MHPRSAGPRAALVLTLTALALLFARPLPAAADSGPVGSDVHVAQTLGERELTVVIRRVDATPGPVRVEVVSHAGSPAGTLHLRLAAVGAASTASAGLAPPGTVTSRADLVLGPTPGLYGSTLHVDRPGPWELAVDDGERVARIPFVVPARVVAPWEAFTYGGFVAAGAFLVIALLTALRARRGWTSLVPAAGVVAAVAVASTAALLSSSIPPPPPPGSQVDPSIDTVTDPYALAAPPRTADHSRPPVNLAVAAPGARAGTPSDVRLTLTDAATGRGVDDLLVHDNALIHLVVVGPAGQLWHLHPIRVGPGDYQAHFTPPEPGTYALAAELARRGGGVQLVRAPGGLDIPGERRPTAPQPPGPGALQQVNGVAAQVGVDGLAVGVASTITATVGTRPDLQPWLGMAGHLIIVGPLPPDTPAVGAAALTAPTWAHAHAMAPVSNAVTGPPDETVAAFGPQVRFTYTFATPGRYRLWVQVEREYAVLTVPVVVDVPTPSGDRP